MYVRVCGLSASSDAIRFKTQLNRSAAGRRVAKVRSSDLILTRRRAASHRVNNNDAVDHDRRLEVGGIFYSILVGKGKSSSFITPKVVGVTVITPATFLRASLVTATLTSPPSLLFLDTLHSLKKKSNKNVLMLILVHFSYFVIISIISF